MSFKGFLKKTGPLVDKSPQSLSDAIVQSQEATQEVFTELKGIPFLDGVWHRGISLSVTPFNLPHKLDRKYLGYIVTGQNAAGSIYVPTSANKEVFLTLQATASMTVDIWVF